jgi:hypothetical protein
MVQSQPRQVETLSQKTHTRKAWQSGSSGTVPAHKREALTSSPSAAAPQKEKHSKLPAPRGGINL